MSKFSLHAITEMHSQLLQLKVGSKADDRMDHFYNLHACKQQFTLCCPAELANKDGVHHKKRGKRSIPLIGTILASLQR
jgi:hypothetical protein